MFYLNMVDYHVFFPLLTTLTWDTSLALRGSQGWYLNHLGPLSPSESFRVGWCVGVWVCGWVAHKIFVASPEAKFGLWIRTWPRALRYYGYYIYVVSHTKRRQRR